MSMSSSSSSSSGTKKSVRFASPEVMGFVTARHDLTTEEMNDTWWSQTDMKEFFKAAKTLSKDAQRDNFMVTGFEEAFKTSKLLATSQNNDNSFALQDKLENIQVDSNLLDWCRFGHSWRGLERSSSSIHNDDRSQAARKAKAMVLQMRPGVNAELVRKAYERASRSAKIFARIMGEADAMVNTVRSSVQKQQRRNSTSTTSSTSGHCGPRKNSNHNSTTNILLRFAL